MSAPIESSDNVSQRITKLLPADITAALLGIKSSVSAASVSDDWIIYGGFAIAVLAPFYFWLIVETRNPMHIAFLLISYLIFFMSIAPIQLGNYFPSERYNIQALNVVITPIWVFLVTPMVAKALAKQLVT